MLYRPLAVHIYFKHQILALCSNNLRINQVPTRPIKNKETAPCKIINSILTKLIDSIDPVSSAQMHLLVSKNSMKNVKDFNCNYILYCESIIYNELIY
jgi:hypothetical protein